MQQALPNTRMQRTRSSPSALRSPLMRCPLGRTLTGHRDLFPVALLAAGLLMLSAPLQASESGEQFVTIGGITLGRATFQDVQTRLGRTNITKAADPHDEQLCYLLPVGDTFLLFVSNDLGGPEHTLIGYEVRRGSGSRPASCLQLSATLAMPFETDVGGIRLGMTRAQFLKVVGQPVKADRKIVMREFARKEPLNGRNYDIVIYIEGEFRGDKLRGFSVSKTETW